MGLVFTADFLHTFSVFFFLLKTLSNDQASIFGESGLVGTLKLEFEGSQFKPQLALSWIFYNCYLVVPQTTLGHSQRDSLTNPKYQNIFYNYD